MLLICRILFSSSHCQMYHVDKDGFHIPDEYPMVRRIMDGDTSPLAGHLCVDRGPPRRRGAQDALRRRLPPPARNRPQAFSLSRSFRLSPTLSLHRSAPVIVAVARSFEFSPRYLFLIRICSHTYSSTHLFIHL